MSFLEIFSLKSNKNASKNKSIDPDLKNIIIILFLLGICILVYLCFLKKKSQDKEDNFQIEPFINSKYHDVLEGIKSLKKPNCIFTTYKLDLGARLANNDKVLSFWESDLSNRDDYFFGHFVKLYNIVNVSKNEILDWKEYIEPYKINLHFMGDEEKRLLSITPQQIEESTSISNSIQIGNNDLTTNTLLIGIDMFNPDTGNLEYDINKIINFMIIM